MNRAEQHNTRENIDRLFSNPAYVKRYLDPSRLRFYEDVIEIIEAKVELDGKKIADMGCATGHLLNIIDRNHKVNQLIGFDFSKVALDIAKGIGFVNRVQFIEHDLNGPLNEFASFFDVVFCTQTMEHFMEPEKVLENMLKTLAPKGMIVITIPDGDVDGLVGIHHINKWNEVEFGSFLIEVAGRMFDSWKYEIGRVKAHHDIWAIIWKEDA